MPYFIGISMLWLENNFRRIYCNAGQKQPSCSCIKHSLYIVKWNQTNEYVVTFPTNGTSLKSVFNERWQRHARGIMFEFWAY